MTPDLVRVVDELVAIVEAQPQDLTWAGYWENQAELVADLRDHAERVRREDTSRLAELRMLFNPARPLQDLAMASGWTDCYMALAARFDVASADERGCGYPRLDVTNRKHT